MTNQGSVYRNSKHRVREIKQHEIITILGDRVRAGKVLMSVIDVAQLVFGQGLSGVFNRQGETMLEDVERCDDN